eukprot:m.47383 g.47383  ORF g.47383 m.47383 type:complete len:224 (-) comp11915_c0_seq2:84-755(-)
MSDDESGDEGPTIGTYEGERHPETQERHGKGLATLPNGDVYDGEYDRGVRHGQGTYKFKNGARYVGSYAAGKKAGQGVFYYPDGSIYDGAWVDDQRCGHGKYTYPNGDTYEGLWANNVREGQGVYTYAATGVKFEGEWAQDVRSGPGTVVHNNHTLSATFASNYPTPGADATYSFQGGFAQQGSFAVAPADEDEEEPVDEEAPPAPTLQWQVTTPVTATAASS